MVSFVGFHARKANGFFLLSFPKSHHVQGDFCFHAWLRFGVNSCRYMLWMLSTSRS